MLFVFVTYLPQLAISLHIMWSFYAIEHALTVHFLLRKVIVKCYHYLFIQTQKHWAFCQNVPIHFWENIPHFGKIKIEKKIGKKTWF